MFIHDDVVVSHGHGKGCAFVQYGLRGIPPSSYGYGFALTHANSLHSTSMSIRRRRIWRKKNKLKKKEKRKKKEDISATLACVFISAPLVNIADRGMFACARFVMKKAYERRVTWPLGVFGGRVDNSTVLRKVFGCL